MGLSIDALQNRGAAASSHVDADARDVPEGYKRTEVGLIPEEWKVSDLGSICSFENGDRGANYPSPRSFASEGIPFINAGHIGGGRIAMRDMDYITQAAFDRLGGGKVHCGDILFCLRGTLGKFGVVEPGLGEGAIASSLVIVRPRSRDLIREFLAFYFASDLCTRMIEKWAGGAAQPNLGSQDLARFSIPIPLTPEQHAIAEALSDVHGLLGALEALIAKKRAIKQGAMQQLLTGKTRLPRFSGEWETKRMGEVLKFQVGCPFSSAYFNEKELGVRLVKNRDLKSDDQIFYYSGNYDPTFEIRDDDVLVGMDGDFLPCRWAKGPALLNQRVGRILPFNGLDRDFALYYLVEPLKEIEIATASTTVKHLSHGDIENIEKPLPSVREQIAIATVLSDMDAEIAVLEARRDKTHAIKQGMMQQLLTGRVRLVKPAPAEATA